MARRICGYCELKRVHIGSSLSSKLGTGWITRYYCSRRKTWCRYKGRHTRCPYYPRGVPEWLKPLARVPPVRP